MFCQRRLILATVFMGFIVFSAGCGGDNKSKVTGTVTYNNGPVKGGSVYLSNDKTTFSSPIQSDGTYMVTDIPQGTYTITIDTESVNPDKKVTPPSRGKGTSGAPQTGPGSKGEAINEEYAAKMGKASGGGGGGGGGEAGGFGPAPIEELRKRYVKIPAKYGSKLTSGLTVEVNAGTVKKDLPLAD